MNLNAANPERASTSRRSHHPPVRRAWPVAVVIATACLAVLPTACGGSGSSTGSDGSLHGHQSVLAFSRCMRTHGVPNFPDPVDEVDLPKISPDILKVSSSQFNAAETACQHLLPPT